MVVYNFFQSHKDENKNESIFQAAIDLINEIGLAETSMSKIAKKANVSSSTIYVWLGVVNNCTYTPMKIKTEREHRKIDPAKTVLKKRLSLLKNHNKVDKRW
nr:helix-turn-helix domain-containing protein [Priestia megaterium]